MILFIPFVFVFYIFLAVKKPAIAFVTVPLAAVTIFVVGNASGNENVMAASPILFFLTLIAILIPGTEIGLNRWPKIAARWILILILLILLCIWMFIISSLFGLFGTGFGIFFIVSIILYFITSRSSTSAYVISTIGSSMRQNLPLPMALEIAANPKDKRSEILKKIKTWLIQGHCLSESIKRGYPMCPADALGIITAAEHINQLPSAMQAIEANMTAQMREQRKLKPVHPLYPIIIISFVFFILWSVMIFIMPVYAATLMEVVDNAQLPGITRFFIGISRFVLQDYGWLFFLIVICFAFIIIPYSIYIRFRPRRLGKPYLISRIGDYIKWHLPLIHWFEKHYSMLQVVEMLRLSLAAGCSLNDSIGYTLGLDINNRFKKYLRNWHERVERGENIAEAARQSKTGPVLAWAFDENINQGNTPAILQMLESFYRANYGYYVNLARSVIWPCIILCMGICVGCLVYAIFLPPVEVIQMLADMAMP